MRLLVISSGGREHAPGNMGVGMVATFSVDRADAALDFIRAQKYKAWLIGEVVKGKGEARVV